MGKREKYLKQTQLPAVTLSDALRIPQAIADNYAKQPTKPLRVGQALSVSPTTGTFRELCGAAVGYGLTDGGPNAAEIALTDIGTRIVAPLTDGDDLVAKREAVLQPSILGEFMRKYDGNPLPTDAIAFNVLESMGVPGGKTKRSLEIIMENANLVGFLQKINNKTFVDLSGAPVVPTPKAETPDSGAGDGESEDVIDPEVPEEPTQPKTLSSNRKVYISHGSNRRVVDQLKELLGFGDFEAVISVEKETPSKPVPQKVMDEMRSCSAGILHVSPEEKLMDQNGDEKSVLNSNVLIEIGAAMALYSGRFILLVEDGTSLPSNLQGLYEVRYSGAELGYEATMKVLKVLNEFKKPTQEAT